jgi:hypothetical protein
LEPFAPDLAEQIAHQRKALRLRSVAQPEHRRAAEVESNAHAAVANAVHRAAAIVCEHRDIAAFEHDGVVKHRELRPGR